MRRKDRLRDETEFLNSVLDDAETIYLAMHNGEYPYCIPVNFARLGQKLYIHCAFEGQKLELIAKDPHVAFSTALDVEIDRAAATTYYRSISGTGLASVVMDIPEKCMALETIGSKYQARCPVPCPPATAARVQIVRIDIVDIHGKQSLKKSPEQS